MPPNLDPLELALVTSRLHRTTRPLLLVVAHTLNLLGIMAVGSPTAVMLVGLYVTGLILLEARQTQTRVTRFLPGRRRRAYVRLLIG